MKRSRALPLQTAATAETPVGRVAAGVCESVAIILAAGTLAYSLVLWRAWAASWIGLLWMPFCAAMLALRWCLGRARRKGRAAAALHSAQAAAEGAAAASYTSAVPAQDSLAPLDETAGAGRGASSRWAAAGLLAATAIFAAGYTLVMNRPDSDGEYLRRALVQLDHWNEPIITSNVTYDVPVPDILPTQYLVSYEMLAAQAARWLQLDPINLYFNVLAAAAAAVCVPVYYLLARAFGLGTRAAVWVAVGAVVFLVLDGNRHTSPGNWAFMRLWQGKSLVITLGVPWAMWLTARFLRRPDPAGWFSLLCLNIAAAGLSTTGLFLMPAVVFLTAAGFVVAGGPAGFRATGARVKLAALAGAACVWPAALSLWVYLTGFGAEGARVSMEIMFARMLQSEPVWLNCLKQIGSWRTALFYGTLLLAAPWLIMTPRDALMLTAVSLGGVAAFFNPLSGPIFCRILGPVYFRLFYALPVAFCAGLFCAAIVHRAARRPVVVRGAVLGGGVLLLVLAGFGRAADWHFPAERVLLAGAAVLLVGLVVVGRTSLGSGWRRSCRVSAIVGLAALFVLQSESYTFMLRNSAFRKHPLAPRYHPPLGEVLAQAGPHLEGRTVLAPCELALAAAVACPRARFAITFDPYTRWSFAMAGTEQQLAPRLAAQQFAAGVSRSPESRRAFEEFAARQVNAVVTDPAAEPQRIARALASAGDWRFVGQTRGYQLFLRSDRPCVDHDAQPPPGIPVHEYLAQLEHTKGEAVLQ